MLKEFKEFAVRGNMIDMAVGIIIGAAFGTIISSLVADIIMPPIGLGLGNVDFSNLFWVMKEGTDLTNLPPYDSLADAQAAGAVTFNYGKFILTLINFLIIAFCIFLMVRVINKMRRPKEVKPGEPTTKECPYCKSTVSIKASRCAFCTSQIEQK
ncbi:MAG: large conductance mechanosensitive channel protein MscL [Dehalococcoidia bacterium]